MKMTDLERDLKHFRECMKMGGVVKIRTRRIPGLIALTITEKSGEEFEYYYDKDTKKEI